MSVETFNFPFHVASISYPERGSPITLGGNWQYSSKPSSPPMRTFQLTFPVLQWIKSSAGVLTSSIDPEINLLRLEQFYNRHELYKDFIYPHELYGQLIVRFSQPLVIPPAVQDSFGTVKGLSVTFVEQPV